MSDSNQSLQPNQLREMLIELAILSTHAIVLLERNPVDEDGEDEAEVEFTDECPSK